MRAGGNFVDSVGVLSRQVGGTVNPIVRAIDAAVAPAWWFLATFALAGHSSMGSADVSNGMHRMGLRLQSLVNC